MNSFVQSGGDSEAIPAAYKPNDVIAFHPAPSTGASAWLLGVVSSTPSTVLANGSVAVLVQPSPLLLVPAPGPSSPRKPKSVTLTARLIDRTNGALSDFLTTPASAASVNNSAVAPNASTLSAHGAALEGVMSAEELKETQEQRASMQADVDVSYARVKEIDAALHEYAQKKKRASTPQARSASISATDAAAAKTTLLMAEKAAESAERDVMLARAGLRTVKGPSWADLQRRTQRTASQSLVQLLETTVLVLHDKQMAEFGDVVRQAPTLPKRLASVKTASLTAEDLKQLHASLKKFPTPPAVEQEHKVAPALYRWLTAITHAGDAQVQLKAAQQAVDEASNTGSRRSASAQRKAEASPDPTPPGPALLSSKDVAALQKERADQLDFAQMAAEEVKALDDLIAEATQLAASAQASASVAAVVVSPVPALIVSADLVLCTLPASEAPDMAACASQPVGNTVSLSFGATQRLLSAAAVSGPPSSAGRGSPKVPRLNLRSVTPDSTGSRGSPVGGSRSNVFSSGLPTSTSLAGQSQRAANAPASSNASAIGDATTTEALAAAREHNRTLEKKLKDMERRLSAALQNNPKEGELQLLRDEVTAKRTELQRVTGERDKLLVERRERSLWGPRRESEARPAGSSPMQPMLGSSAVGRQMSTPRDFVDRSIVDELEEKLNAAHTRIGELQVEVARTQRRPSVAPAAQSPLTLLTLTSPPSAAAASSDSGLPPTHPLTPGAVVEASPAAADTNAASAVLPSCESSIAAPAGPELVSRELYDGVEERLRTALAELETKKQGVQTLVEHLNAALHRCAEAESAVLGQKKELAEVWEKLEAANAREEEQSQLVQQQQRRARAKSTTSTSRWNAPDATESVGGSSAPDLQHGVTIGPTALQISHQGTSPARTQEHEGGNLHQAEGVDADGKSQMNDDEVTVLTANGYTNNFPRLAMDHPFRSHSPGAVSAACPSVVDPATGTSFSGVVSRGREMPSTSGFARGRSVAALQMRPVEHLSTIELRHEVHRLREEVERHQSGELRLSMDLQTIREKHKAERKHRREARAARMQMLTRMQETITASLDTSAKDLEHIPALLDRSRAEAEALMQKRRMSR